MPYTSYPELRQNFNVTRNDFSEGKLYILKNNYLITIKIPAVLHLYIRSTVM